MSDGIFPTFGVIAPVPDYLKALEPYRRLPLPRRLSRRRPPRAERARHLRLLRRQERPLLLRRDHEQGLRRPRRVHPREQGLHRPHQSHLRRLSRGDAEPDAGHGRLDRPGWLVARREPERRERLRRNVARMKGGMKKLGFEMNDTPVPDRHLDPEVRRGHEEGPGGPLRPGHRRGAPEICRRPGRRRPPRLDLLRAHDRADRPAPLRAQASRLKKQRGEGRGSGRQPGRTVLSAERG
ncbi:MAG: hypothetical protein M0C28_07735 [Candidatus Moduliflexus flocculans]|nr:hypothetical protein [Candidatus Moduliflexus flocculans]